MSSLAPEFSLPESQGSAIGTAVHHGKRWMVTLAWLRRLSALGAALVLLCLLVGVAVFAPLLAPNDPLRIDMADTLFGPTGDHFFGTDHVGRDVLSRAVFGARILLLIGVASVMPAALLGMALGVIGGYFGET